MTNPKLNLSLQVPGACMLSQQECCKNPKDSYDTTKMMVEYEVTDTEGKKTKKRKVKELINIRTRKSVPAKQNIVMSEEAYKHMLETPVDLRTSLTAWLRMPEDQRLKAHLDCIAHDMRAISYTYEILGD